MTQKCKIKATQPVLCQGICATLHNNDIGGKHLHHLCDDWLKYQLEREIIHSFGEWKINAIPFPSLGTNIRNISSTWKKCTILMKRHCKNTVCGIKRFLHRISMMDVDVNIQNTLMAFQQFQNGKNNVVNITKS